MGTIRRVDVDARPALRLLIALGLLLGIAAAPATVAAASPGSWTQFGYNATKSGFDSAEHRLSTANVAGLGELWKSQLPQGVFGSTVVSEGRVFVSGWYGGLYALRALDGHLLWTASVGDTSYQATPIIYGGTVIACGDKVTEPGGGVVAAFAMGSGKTIWKTMIPSGIYNACPTLYGDRLFFGSGSVLYGASAKTGKILWSRVVSTLQADNIGGPVAVARGLVVASTTGGILMGIRASDGKRLWKARNDGGLWRGGPAISGTRIFVAGSSSTGFALNAFRLSDGKRLWTAGVSASADDSVNVTATAGGGMVYIGTTTSGGRSGWLSAYSAATGAVHWRNSVQGAIHSQAALANGVLYEVTESGNVLIYDARTGGLLTRIEVSSSAFTNWCSPVVSGGRIYIGSGEGIVRAFGLK